MVKDDLKIEFNYSEDSELEIKKLSNKDIDSMIQESNVIEVANIETVPDSFEDVEIVHDTSEKSAITWEVKVLSIGNWPEFKTKTCYKWIRIPLNGRTKVPYPCMWRRTCNKAWYLRVVFSGGVKLPDNIEKIIQECSKLALIPALPILLTGNIGGAVSAFLASFKPCLIAKGVSEAARFSVSFVSRKKCSQWKRV